MTSSRWMTGWSSHRRHIDRLHTSRMQTGLATLGGEPGLTSGRTVPRNQAHALRGRRPCSRHRELARGRPEARGVVAADLDDRAGRLVAEKVVRSDRAEAVLAELKRDD